MTHRERVLKKQIRVCNKKLKAAELELKKYNRPSNRFLATKRREARNNVIELKTRLDRLLEK